MSWVDEVTATHRHRILRLVPAADVRLSGGALVDGANAVDVDLVVLVYDVGAAANLLLAEYPALYPEEWREDWAAFREPGPPQVDLVVTRRGTRGDDHHRRAWELLAETPELLAEYRQLRESRGGDYEARKAVFFERVVALLPRV
jgi:hypothetical protein